MADRWDGAGGADGIGGGERALTLTFCSELRSEASERLEDSALLRKGEGIFSAKGETAASGPLALQERRKEGNGRAPATTERRGYTESVALSLSHAGLGLPRRLV
jgi:hypothetical protein